MVIALLWLSDLEACSLQGADGTPTKSIWPTAPNDSSVPPWPSLSRAARTAFKLLLTAALLSARPLIVLPLLFPIARRRESSQVRSFIELELMHRYRLHRARHVWAALPVELDFSYSIRPTTTPRADFVLVLARYRLRQRDRITKAFRRDEIGLHALSMYRESRQRQSGFGSACNFLSVPAARK